MKISCIIVSYNNGDLLKDAIMSVVQQTRPVSEIIVADDASTDGSRGLIEALATSYPSITPILRERNVGVTINRDLAIRGASGDFITTLDGDDFFQPTKIEQEVRVLAGSKSHIAYTDVRHLFVSTGRSVLEEVPEFATLDASERVRWFFWHRTHHPLDMLFAKDIHLAIGGYRHDLRTWEDWDYKLRLASAPYTWIHTGSEGVVVRIGTGGLSAMPPMVHLREQYKVMSQNSSLVRRHAGSAFYLLTVSRVALIWLRVQIKQSYSRRRARARELIHALKRSSR